MTDRVELAVGDGVRVGSSEHVALWDAINAFAVACGGRAESISVARMTAVASVETALRALVAAIERVEVARLLRQIETAAPWPTDGEPLDEEQMRALRLRWSTGPELYQADADALIATTMRARAAIDRVGAVLSANGCDCDCDHHHEEHDDDCELCLACRIDAALQDAHEPARMNAPAPTWHREHHGDGRWTDRQVVGEPVPGRTVPAEPAPPRLFDVWCNGHVHYTRPEGDPLLEEARQRTGYEVRPHVPPSQRVEHVVLEEVDGDVPA